MRPRSPTFILLSIACAAFIAGFGLLIWQLNRVTPTTDLINNPQLRSLDLAVVPSTILPMPAAATEAELIRKAIDEYIQSPDRYSHASADVLSTPAVDLLIQAQAAGERQIFQAHPSEIITFDREKPKLEALSQLGRYLTAGGLTLTKSDPAKAEKVFAAEFNLGARLYAERLCFAELSTGMALMADASEGLKILATAKKNAARIGQIESFQAGCKSFTQSVLKLEAAICAIDFTIIDEHAGDVRAIAVNTQCDRMWRVEGTLATARLRFSAMKKGDQRYAEKALDVLEADPDIIVQTAARAGKTLNVQSYRAQ